MTTHGVRVFKTATQSISNNTATALTFDTKVFDTDTYYTLNGTNFVVPAGLQGYYILSGSFIWAGTTSTRQLTGAINVNGTGVCSVGALTTSSSDNATCALSCVVFLNAADIVTIIAFQQTGVSLNTSFFQQETMFSMILAGT